MPQHDFSSPRLFVKDDLSSGVVVHLEKPAQNYVSNVLRLRQGDVVLVFNGRDGEFAARLDGEAKRLVLRLESRTREQTPKPALRWLFAPLKHARLDYMVQKAVEMGVGSLEPVMTRRTQVARVNLERMRANVIEAAEQCGVLAVPSVHAERPLMRVLDDIGPATHLVFCDEAAEVADPLAALFAIPEGEVALLIGPEGGFDEAERRALLALPGVSRLALGPRILRADTAAVAALALVQAARGDWRG
jgi:16S rRNA (uracil1498-N3)-methyltransferase